MSSQRSNAARGKIPTGEPGAHHWWLQRVSALALIPLALWFGFSILNVVDADYASAQQWVANPCNAVLSILFIVFMGFHGQLGLQVVIEDYVHRPAVKIAALLAVKAALLLAVVCSVYAILRITL